MQSPADFIFSSNYVDGRPYGTNYLSSPGVHSHLHSSGPFWPTMQCRITTWQVVHYYRDLELMEYLNAIKTELRDPLFAAPALSAVVLNEVKLAESTLIQPLLLSSVINAPLVRSPAAAYCETLSHINGDGQRH